MKKYLIIYCSIGLGSLLLFLIEPMLGKYILPFFGGTAAVWTVALFFFQVLLLLGYAYTVFLSKYSLKSQSLIQATFILGVILFVP